jgi:hypothetical protein
MAHPHHTLHYRGNPGPGRTALGTLFTTCGFLLLVAAASAMSSPVTPPRRGWPHPQATVRQTAAERFGTIREATGTAIPSGPPTAMMREPDAVHHPRATTAQDGNGAEPPLGPGIIRADSQRKAWLAGNCRGTRAESAHLATIPLTREDPRDMLARMAAAAYLRVPFTWSCPCPMGVPAQPIFSSTTCRTAGTQDAARQMERAASSGSQWGGQG